MILFCMASRLPSLFLPLTRWLAVGESVRLAELVTAIGEAVEIRAVMTVLETCLPHLYQNKNHKMITYFLS